MATVNKATSSRKSTFVFQGTVLKLGAATMRTVPVDKNTAIVHVEQVLEAPQNLSRYAGRDITVQLAPRGKAAVGHQLIFHTAGWMFGDSIAVRAEKQEPVKRTLSAARSRGIDPIRQRDDREMHERVAAADLVVLGKVVAVKLPGESEVAARATRTARAMAPANVKPVSEHDPKWREAVVEVDQVQKGQHRPNRVTVLFPSSTDVRWYKAPKFTAGQQGFFALHKAKIKESERLDTRARALTVAPADKEVEVYTALHPADFQPVAHEERIRGAIARASVAKPIKGR
jgi:hypothetical protein